MCIVFKGTLSLAERSLLKKQSGGLFFNSPFAERPAAVCGTLSHTLQGLSALDLTKGLANPLETHYQYNECYSAFP